MHARPQRHAGAERLYTIPITCRLDGQAHDVTDENVAAGQRTGQYAALCGYVVVAAPLVAPVGRPCPKCSAVSKPTTAAVRQPRRRRPGRLWWMFRPHSHAAVGTVTRPLP